MERDLCNRRVLITGANVDVGRATALALARRGARLFLAGRSAERTRGVLDELRAAGSAGTDFLELDLADLSSVRQCAEQFLARGEALDVLINNAGVAGRRGLTKDGFELMFGVNHLGHFLLTELLKPKLCESARQQPEAARIVNVSSEAHYRVERIHWERLRERTRHFSGMPEYGVSKLCNVLHAKELARRFRAAGENVHTYALHPGVIASEIWREVPWPIRPVMKRWMKPTDEGAKTSVYCATSRETAAESGLFYDSCRAVAPSRLAEDDALARELYDRSLRYVGLA